ncbi:hypothetical protein [Pseudomonas phage U1B]|nr:hypothetical protein [Pseudomonas phage T2P]QYV99158.1 hypothetical protein [Pseudomonas phage U1B]QYV99613.1 hypothetical protein [Pseudomonas phage U5]
MEHQEQKELLKQPLQTLYNLTFNPVHRGGAKGPDWIRLSDEVILYPNGLDVTINAVTKPIRWELDEYNVINITYVPAMFFNKGLKAIETYLKHTE